MRVRLALVVAVLAAGTLSGQALKSGLELSHFDTSVRPQDDLFRYANGAWVERASMPGDRVTHGVFTEIADKADRDLRAVIEAVAGQPQRLPGSPAQQIGDLYASLMDEDRIESLGWQPIQPEIARIEAMSTVSELAYRCGYLSSTGTSGPFGGTASADGTNPRSAIVTFAQGGTLLPDRDYYLSPDPKFSSVREKYREYLVQIFTLVGRRDPAGDAKAVLALETELARAQLPMAEARESGEHARRFALKDLAREMPEFDWTEWARPQGIEADAHVVLAQPEFFRHFAKLVPATPMTVWRPWLVARHVTAKAPFISSPFANARFELFGRVLSGQIEPIVQWKRSVALVNGYLGDAVGRLYVEKHFPPDAKVRVERLVANMTAATRVAIVQANWMSRETKEAALAKLRSLTTKIGYPEEWRDYSGLVIRPNDLLGNIERAIRFDNAYRMNRVRRPLGRGEWLFPPQTVNAYYSPSLNEIVVPAALLQPPLFQMDADDAVNYGGIGAVIGHELGHGFDERGRYFDAGGVIADWWRADDVRRFQQLAEKLIAQFNGYSPLPGMRVSGNLTLGENIGDLGGLALAYRAYKISLNGKEAPVIDGFTGDQRFFLGWAQVWRSQTREEYLRQWLLWIPHAPPQYRANGPLSNLDAFYAAFSVKPGDKMFVEPEKRVRIW